MLDGKMTYLVWWAGLKLRRRARKTSIAAGCQIVADIAGDGAIDIAVPPMTLWKARTVFLFCSGNANGRHGDVQSARHRPRRRAVARMKGYLAWVTGGRRPRWPGPGRYYAGLFYSARGAVRWGCNAPRGGSPRPCDGRRCGAVRVLLFGITGQICSIRQMLLDDVDFARLLGNAHEVVWACLPR